MPLSGMCAMPMFGVMISGLPGAALILAMVALWAYLAWALYRLKPAGWWLTVAVFTVFMVSTILNALNLDLMEMYRAMGYPEQQIGMIERYGMFSGGSMWWLTAAIFLPMLGYMLYVKRYFQKPT
ncbi:MAG: hypothetical protein NTW87_06365 [Planctomycetota bacterium]|nr:hypothetical protein [Planctomycetota bacterium]